MLFESLLSNCGAEMAPLGHHHIREGWLQFDCPFCSLGWRRYRMGYNISGNYCNCYSCGPHSAYSVLVEYGIERRIAYQVIGDFGDYVQPEKGTGKVVLPSGLGALEHSHKTYLRGRGHSIKRLVRLWGLQGIGIALRNPWSIFIPIYFRGEMVSWTTRRIGSSGKYGNARPGEEKISAKSLLFGEDYCRHACIICEGPFDVFKIGPGAVATLGLAYTKKQVEKMSKYAVRCVCFDNEDKAQDVAVKLCRELEVFPGETYRVVLESGKDPGDASRKEIRELRKRFLGGVND